MTWKLDKAIAASGWRLAHEWPSVAAARAWYETESKRYTAYKDRPAWLGHFQRGLWQHSRRRLLQWVDENPGKVELWKAQPEFEQPGESRPDPGFLVIRQQGTNRPLHLYRLDFGHRRSSGATVDEIANHMGRYTAAGFEHSHQMEIKQAERRAEAHAERDREQALYDDAEAMLADCGFEDVAISRGALRSDMRGPKVVISLEDFLTLVRAVHRTKLEEL